VDADGSQAANGVPDVLDQVKYATDYLERTYVSADLMIARVGGDQDHDLWVTSPYQSTLDPAEGGEPRPVNPHDSAKADVAAMTAASLALMARLYEPFDATLASQYLTVAEQAFAYAAAHPGTTSDNFYEDSNEEDNVLCGAVELFRATGDEAYLTEARDRNRAINEHGWVVDWSNAADYCRHSLAVVEGGPAVSYWSRTVERYRNAVSGDQYVSGLIYFGEWGSLRYGLGAGFSAALYATLTGDIAAKDLAQSQFDYAQGNNEYGRSFVVGVGENPPRWPHHRNAYGQEVFDGNFAASPTHSLLGALVGGPTKDFTDVSSAGYDDSLHDYIGNEVTIEYNSSLVGLAAFAVIEERSTP
jgi:endoglucanase